MALVSGAEAVVAMHPDEARTSGYGQQIQATHCKHLVLFSFSQPSYKKQFPHTCACPYAFAIN